MKARRRRVFVRRDNAPYVARKAIVKHAKQPRASFSGVTRPNNTTTRSATPAKESKSAEEEDKTKLSESKSVTLHMGIPAYDDIVGITPNFYDETGRRYYVAKPTLFPVFYQEFVKSGRRFNIKEQTLLLVLLPNKRGGKRVVGTSDFIDFPFGVQYLDLSLKPPSATSFSSNVSVCVNDTEFPDKHSVGFLIGTPLSKSS